MKIQEITENFKQLRHSVETSIFPNSVMSVDISIKKILKKYKEGNISPNEAIQYLEIIESFTEELFYSDYFDYVLATIPKHSKKLSEDWLLLENELKNTIQEIKQRNNIREDITDFKAADGQLSAMGSKRVKRQLSKQEHWKKKFLKIVPVIHSDTVKITYRKKKVFSKILIPTEQSR